MNDVLDLTSLSSAMPLNEWRLRQCQFLSEAAFIFVLLHELSHWLLGHTAYARELGLTDELGLDEVDVYASIPEPVSQNRDRLQCIEMQADTLAFETLQAIHADEDDTESILRRYNDALAVESAPEQTLMRVDKYKAMRVMAVSTALVIFILESLRNKHSSAPDGAHPYPETRAYNILRTQLILSLFDYGEVRNDEFILRDIPEIDIGAVFKSITRETLAPFIYDIKYFAPLLGVPNLFVEPADRPLTEGPTTFQDSPVLADLTSEISRSKDRHEFLTIAANRDAALKSLSRFVRSECEKYAHLKYRRE